MDCRTEAITDHSMFQGPVILSEVDDPRMSRAVHVMRPDGKPVTIINEKPEF